MRAVVDNYDFGSGFWGETLSKQGTYKFYDTVSVAVNRHYNAYAIDRRLDLASTRNQLGIPNALAIGIRQSLSM